jgi:tripartite-type tricarboxylate transporter receptor subunit TctC
LHPFEYHGAALLASTVVASALLFFTVAAQAQSPATAPSYPDRRIRFIVPYPPGGGNDIVGRIIAQGLQAALKQTVLVENRGGAGGTLGTDIAAKAAPDGYTMVINNVSLAVNATSFSKLPYDTRKDLLPVSIIARQANILVIRPDLKVRSVRQLLDLARDEPYSMIYGSGGRGSSSHLAAERLQLVTQTRMTHVPFNGLGPAINQLGLGKVDFILATVSSALPALNAGKVDALAVTTAKRSAFFPQLPTLMEAGVPNFEASTWYALLVPVKTPPAVVARLNDALAKISSSDDAKKQFTAQGLESAHTTVTEARAYLEAEIERWAPVVRASGAKPE